MCDYSLVIYFSYCKAFVHIVENRTFQLDREKSIYDSSCVVNQDFTKLIRIDDNPIKPNFLDIENEHNYIDNIITYTIQNYKMKNQTDKIDSFNIFSQYLKFILTDFVKNLQKRTYLPEQINNHNFTFITPRIWGYHINENDIYSIFHQTGLAFTGNLEKNVTVFTDLCFYLDTLQRKGLSIRSLKRCLFCTYFVETGPSGPVIHNNVDVFQSGLSYEYEKVFNRKGKIIPVNAQSITSLTAQLDLMRINRLLEDYIRKKTESYDIDLILGKIYHCLMGLKLVDTNEEHLKRIYPFRDTEVLNTWNSMESPKLKNISIQDIFDIIRPLLQDHCSCLKSILEALKIQEVFLECFDFQLQIDSWHTNLAWISLYFLKLALSSEVPKYRSVRFVHAVDLFCFCTNKTTYINPNWSWRYTLPFHNSGILKTTLSNYDTKSIHTIKGDMITSILESDHIVLLSLEIDNTHLSVYSKNSAKILKKSKYWDDNEPICALNHITKIDFESGNPSYSGLQSLRQRLMKTMENYCNHVVSVYPESHAKSNTEFSEINEINESLHHRTCKLLSYESILVELYRIQLQSKESIAKRQLFQRQYFTIFLILYLTYLKNTMSSKFDFDNPQVRYAIVLDPYIEDIIGKNRMLLKHFTRMFDFLPKNATTFAVPSLTIFNQRDLYSLKIQEHHAYKKIPVYSYFSQVQITKNYCQISMYNLILDSNTQKAVPVIEYGTTTYICFYETVTENVWNYLQEYHQNDPNFDIKLFVLKNFDGLKTKVTGILSHMTSDTNLDIEMILQLCDGLEYQITFRTLIEVAIKPAMKRIMSTVLCYSKKKANYVRQEQIFITLEDMEITTTCGRTSSIRPILMEIVLSLITEFCENDVYYIEEDYTLMKPLDIHNEKTIRDIFGPYATNSGINKPYLAFDSTFAIKFCPLNNIDVEIYTANSKHENPQKLDIDNYYVLAKENDTVWGSWRDFRLLAPINIDCLVEVFRIDDSVQEYTIDSKCMATLNHHKVGSLEVASHIFSSGELPIFTISISFYRRYPIKYICLKVGELLYATQSFNTIDSFKIIYNDY